jgi:hypothetical protein
MAQAKVEVAEHNRPVLAQLGYCLPLENVRAGPAGRSAGLIVLISLSDEQRADLLFRQKEKEDEAVSIERPLNASLELRAHPTAVTTVATMMENTR